MPCLKRPIEYDQLFRMLIFLCPLVVILYSFGSGISGNDFWWHVKVGEYVVNTGEVPRTDIFSWYGMEMGIAWTAHEWLADVLFFLLHHVFGEWGIFGLSIGGAAALYFCLWSVAKKYAMDNLLFSGIFFALFAVLSSMFFYGRPHMFSYFLLFAELYILYKFWDNPSDKTIYFIPLIAVLWSNLHGGSSSVAYLLCLLFLVCGLLRFAVGRIEAERLSSKALLTLLGVTVLTIAGIFVNPIGAKVFTYPYTNLSDELSMTLISEWQAPDAKLIGHLVLFFLPILLMTIGVIAAEKKVRLVDMAVMLFFLFLFFRSMRFIMLWYIAAPFYAFRYMPKLKVKSIRQLSEKIAVIFLAVALVLPCVIGIENLVQTHRQGQLISTAAADDAMKAIRDDAPQRIFNDYNIGESLIYYDLPVFFDARADLYAQENILADGATLMYLEQANPNAKESGVDVDGLIEKYGFDAIAILKTRPLYSYIISHPDRFNLVYEDDAMAYYRIREVAENE